ncbi:MAG: Nramp family divalent metal transporter [Desulfurococcales archaeon]|nr:Nramp family divalent metal transporter [Desulfurococcales archaeon]
MGSEEREEYIQVGNYPIRKVKEVPIPKSILLLGGPAIIELGLALGSGETIIWPTLGAKYGFILVWGAFIGLLLQTIWTQEMTRWSIVSGEHHIQGAGRVIGMAAATWLFLFLGYVAFIWPGWMIGGASAFQKLVGGWPEGETGLLFWTYFWAIIVLAAVLLSPIARKALEVIETGTLFLAWIIIIITVVTATSLSDWGAMIKQMFTGIGDRPEDLDWWTFAASIAFVGAGGLANIWYTFWVRDAGFGMGKYVGTIPGITGKPTAIDIYGAVPEGTEENARRIRAWSRNMNNVLWLVFFLGNLITVLMFIALSYALLYKTGVTPGMNIGDIKGQILQLTADAIAAETPLGDVGGKLYLLAVWLILFNTQVALMEGLVRQAADTLYITYEGVRNFVKKDIRKWYAYWWGGIILVEFLLVGLAVIRKVSYGDLVVFGAVMSLVAMTISPLLVLYINTSLIKQLPEKIYKAIKPNTLWVIAMVVAFLFYLTFLIIAVLARLGII